MKETTDRLMNDNGHGRNPGHTRSRAIDYAYQRPNHGHGHGHIFPETKATK
jgi:hypothetical protein